MAAAVAASASNEMPKRQHWVKKTSKSTSTSVSTFDDTLFIAIVRKDVSAKSIFTALRKLNIGFIGKIQITPAGYMRGGHEFNEATIPVRWNQTLSTKTFRELLTTQHHIRVFYSQDPPLFWKVQLQTTPTKTPSSHPNRVPNNAINTLPEPSKTPRNKQYVEDMMEKVSFKKFLSMLFLDRKFLEAFSDYAFDHLEDSGQYFTAELTVQAFANKLLERSLKIIEKAGNEISKEIRAVAKQNSESPQTPANESTNSETKTDDSGENTTESSKPPTSQSTISETLMPSSETKTDDSN